MKDFWIITDHRTETISSLLRWFFVLICIPLFYYGPIANVMHFNQHTFPLLLTVGITYMAATQVVLYRFPENSFYYRIFTRGGILFDYTVYVWLLQLTGRSESVFFPIAYLMVIHAAIYWRLKGSFRMATAIFVVYITFFITDGGYHEVKTFMNFFINTSFLWLIALYGGVIASKERKYYFEKNKYQLESESDYLTGLPNHRKFQEDLFERVQLNVPFTLVLCDIDHFKKINDAHGHIIGDEVLKSVAATFTRHLFKKEGDAYRYGGEEFAMIINTVQKETVKQIIEDINIHLSRFPFMLQSEEIPITLSYGVAFYKTGDKPADLIKRADNLLYEAKASGRDTIIIEKQKIDENQLIM